MLPSNHVTDYGLFSEKLNDRIFWKIESALFWVLFWQIWSKWKFIWKRVLPAFRYWNNLTARNIRKKLTNKKKKKCQNDRETGRQQWLQRTFRLIHLILTSILTRPSIKKVKRKKFQLRNFSIKLPLSQHLKFCGKHLLLFKLLDGT